MPRALVVCTLLLGRAALSAPQGPPPSPVLVEPARLDTVQDRRRVTGELRAARRAVVAAREPGLVSEVLVREGAAVSAGQVLVRLDASLLEAELAINAAERTVAEATLVEREAQAAQAEADRSAIEQLFERQAANPKELSDARSVAAAVAARLAQARAALEVNAARRALLEERLADMTPVAPFDGHVVARAAEHGQWVAEGGALVELASSGLEAWLDVPQGLFAAVAGADEAVNLVFDGGLEVVSQARRALPLVSAEARTFKLILEIAPDRRLVPGMSLVASLPVTGQREALTVRRDAVLQNEVGTYIYVAAPGGDGEPHHAVFVPVDVLFYAGERAALRPGMLEPGALVVVEGNERLFPSAPLLPSPASPDGTGAGAGAGGDRP